MISLIVLKLGILLTLMVCTIIAALVPSKLAAFCGVVEGSPGIPRWSTGKNIISLLSCFAGGVFLGTCFLDLLPTCRERLDMALDLDFPIAEFSLVGGMLLVLVIEQTVMTCREQKRTIKARCYWNKHETRQSEESSVQIEADNDSSEHDLSSGDDETGLVPMFSSGRVQSKPSSSPSSSSSSSPIKADPMPENSCLRSVLMLLALSLHSTFEGVALGLQPNMGKIFHIFGAVVIHKSVIAFSLGMKFVQSQLSTCVLLSSSIVFASTAPVGIIIGATISDLRTDSPGGLVVDGLLQGVACGTFLYVVFFEILPHEFTRGRGHINGLLRTLFVVVGYSCIAVLLVAFPEEP